MRLPTGRFGTGGRVILPLHREVNWNHPLASRLAWFAAPGVPSVHELLSGHPGGLVIDGGGSAGSFGIATRMGCGAGSRAAGGGVYWPFSERLTRITRDFTFVFWINVHADSFGYVWTVNYDGVTFWKVSLNIEYNNPNNTFDCRFFDNGGTQHKANGPTNMYTGGSDGLACIAIRREGSNCEFFINGVNFGNGSFGSTNDVDWNTKEDVTIATRSTFSPGDGLQGEIPLFHLFDGQLTDAEIYSLYSEPLQLLEEDIPIVAPAGAGPTRTPDFMPFFFTPQGTGAPSRAGYGVAA